MYVRNTDSTGGGIAVNVVGGTDIYVSNISADDCKYITAVASGATTTTVAIDLEASTQPSGAPALPWLDASSTTTWHFPSIGGTATPEAAVAAGIGRLFSRSDGGANTSLYVKESGTGNTGWAGVVTIQASPETYTPTNVVTDRAYDANSTTLAEVADILGTLIADLQTIGLLA